MEKPKKEAVGVTLEMKRIDSLTPYLNNTRSHSEEQIKEIAASIKKFGFLKPVLVWRGQVVAGNGAVAAAKLLGLDVVPARTVDQLTEHQMKAYAIADNRLAEKSTWDQGMLFQELKELQKAEFDFAGIGFDESFFAGFSSPDEETEEPKYDLVNDESNDVLDEMRKETRKAIQIEFETQDYDEAKDVIKFWREKGLYIGRFLVEKLQAEKEKL